MSNAANQSERRSRATSPSVRIYQSPSKGSGMPTEDILPCPLSITPDVVQHDMLKEMVIVKARPSTSVRSLSSLRMRFTKQATIPNLNQWRNVRRS